MKILILQNGWSGQGISGGDKHLVDLASFWKEKHGLTFLLPRNGKIFLRENFKDEIVGLKLLKSWEIWPFRILRSLPIILLGYLLRTIGASLQLSTLEKFDQAISSSHFFYDVFPLLILKFKFRTKIAVYVYHLLSYQNRSPGLRNLVSLRFEDLSLRLIKGFADLVFTDNRQTYDQLLRRGVKVSKIKLMRLGIRRPPHLPPTEKKYDLCFLGRLVKAKGTDDLLEIFSALKVKNHILSLVILGIGDEETHLKERFFQRGFSRNVFFLGSVSEEVKYQTLSRSRIFVSPSYEEGWGMALGEALACGVPAVVYDLPVLQEVYPAAPIFVDKGDRAAMAQAIQRLLSDNDFYQQKVRQGLAIVSEYYLDPLAAKELSLLENL